jgi:hypothetical protein
MPDITGKDALTEAASFMGRLPLVISMVIFLWALNTALLVWLFFRMEKKREAARQAEEQRIQREREFYIETMKERERTLLATIDRVLSNVQIAVETETTLISEMRLMRNDLQELLNEKKMSLFTTISCILMAILGQAVHITFIALPDAELSAKKANAEFSFEQYFKKDARQIIGTAIVCIMLAIGYSELVSWEPSLANWPKWIFALTGFCGSTVAVKAFSKTKSAILSMIDKKANAIDELAPDAVSNNISDHEK